MLPMAPYNQGEKNTTSWRKEGKKGRDMISELLSSLEAVVAITLKIESIQLGKIFLDMKTHMNRGY